MGELPDVVFQHVKEHWQCTGMAPVLLYRLLERGWSFQEIDKVMTFVIGEDYARVNVTEWLDRLEAKGTEFPMNEDGSDTIPVVEVLDRIMFSFAAMPYLCASC
jgi:hypothetical protein